MREIKFKGLAENMDTGKRAWHEYGIGTKPHFIGHYKWIVQDLQYIGIKDKFGREIYEGDIVHYRYLPGPGMWNAEYDAVISWKSTGFYMTPIRGQGTTGWLISIPGAYGDVDTPNDLFEIIGDIYSNPELLKEAE
jgi:uncharacterized phage protein (TIGR01671 family)